MARGFRNYDKWKLASPEDAEDEREQNRLKANRDCERADEMRDRDKDEQARWAEIENAMLHGGM